MKVSTKRGADRSKRLKTRKVAGVGNDGLATVATSSHATKTIPWPLQKVGLGPDSIEGLRKVEPRCGEARTQITPEVPGCDLALTLPTVNVTELVVKRIPGDDGDQYLLFETAIGRLVRSIEFVMHHELKLMSDLRRVGVIATSRTAKAEIKRRIDYATPEPNVIAATHVGYERKPVPRYFVYGDGSVITPLPDLAVVPVLEPRDRFEFDGDLISYENGLARVLQDQPFPLTVFFFGLAQLIKPFVAGTGYKAENMMLELVGRTSTYKSALACTVAGSAWGKPHALDGYARSWNMSEQKIEELFNEFNDHLLILDEVTAAHSSEKTRAERVLNTVHRLSSGQGRARTGMPTASHSVSMLSTSNEPMRLILPATDDVRRALEVRLVSFHATAEENGFFRSVPEGFESVAHAMEHVFATTAANYGLLARQLASNILALLHQDPRKLSGLIQRALDDFIECIGVKASGGNEALYRRAQPFAQAYAAAIMAFETNTLERRHWGEVKEGIRDAWIAHGSEISHQRVNPRLLSYMTNTSNIFVDSRTGEKPPINDSNFRRVAGIFYLGKQGTLRLAIPKAKLAATALSLSNLRQLREEGGLSCGKNNLQTKLELRICNGQPQRDVFYVFTISEIPPQVNLRRPNPTLKNSTT